MQSTLAILMAGGAGERLAPLTNHIAKPAVSFGGSYRIIDFTLSNCINSDVRRVFVLTQYKALELTRHIREGWSMLPAELGEFIEVVPPMKRVHEGWYLGTADAVFQNVESIEAEDPQQVLVLAGDHIYKMDYRELLECHHGHDADITLATIQIPPEQADRFGVVEIDEEQRVVGFEEKPRHGHPKRSPFNGEMVSASMGVYLFRTEVLLRALHENAADADTSHDFGKDILPKMVEDARVFAYDFHDLNEKAAKYWRDVGTLDAYYEANMDLVQVIPELNLYDDHWPLRSRPQQSPPAKFVFAQEGRRMGIGMDSIISSGCVISGGRVVRCVLSPGVRVNSYCEVQDSILLPNAVIGRYSRIRRAIIDANANVPEGSVIGHDPDADRARGYLVTESGIVVVSSERRMHPARGR
jgi:glucose-1-phosphate adenylyltransferase